MSLGEVAVGWQILKLHQMIDNEEKCSSMTFNVTVLDGNYDKFQLV